MRKTLRKTEIIKILNFCQKEYEKNLLNKKILFIYENKDRSINKIEVYFGKRNFYHLTGVRAVDKIGKNISPSNFYNLLKRNELGKENISIKNDTTDLKLQVLPQIMRIDKCALMIGDFSGTNIFLQTEKIAGNTNACIGFVKNQKLNKYFPNTILKEDIRKIVKNRGRIIAILKKDSKEKLYSNITYLKRNYKIENILRNEEINKIVDIKNLHSKSA